MRAVPCERKGSRVSGMAYAYRYHTDSEGKDDLQKRLEEAESMRYIQASIAMLTGGCEICKHAEGLFCIVHKRPVKTGDSRCTDFARRLPEDPREASRAQAERFVRETLGLSQKNLKRVIGES